MLRNKPLVTIYIPSKDYGDYVEKAIQSVIKQVYGSWELILIDEGSIDKTSKIFNYFKSRYKDKITILSHDKPKGLQKLANEVLGLARGKYMIRLDADDWFHEFAIEVLVYHLEKNPKVGIAFPNYYYTNSKGDIIGTETRQFNSKIDLGTQLPPHGACTLFETKALKVAGGYSEAVNAQDGWELWLKLYNNIGAIGVDLPLFYYRQHKTSLSNDNLRLLKARTNIIEKIGSQLIGDYKPLILGVIPIKESYPNFKNVPFKIINGKSLLETALINAQKSQYISDVIVSSKSKKVLDYSKKLEIDNKVKKHYRFMREKEKESRNFPIIDILSSAAEEYFKINNKFPDILIYLSLHSINRKDTHIDKAINMLKISNSDSVVSVFEERDPTFKYSDAGLELINPGRFRSLAYDNERLYKFNGSMIVTWWDNIKENKLFGTKTSFIEMTSNESFKITTSKQMN